MMMKKMSRSRFFSGLMTMMRLLWSWWRFRASNEPRRRLKLFKMWSQWSVLTVILILHICFHWQFIVQWSFLTVLIRFDNLVVAVVVRNHAGTHSMCIDLSVDKSERRRRAHKDNTQHRRPPQTTRMDDDDRVTECFQKSWVNDAEVVVRRVFSV